MTRVHNVWWHHASNWVIEDITNQTIKANKVGVDWPRPPFEKGIYSKNHPWPGKNNHQNPLKKVQKDNH